MPDPIARRYEGEANLRKLVTLLAVTLFTGFLYPPQSHAQASGLVAAYSFNEGAGTTVTDLSGNNITGTIVGATWTNQGKYGNALSFNGTSSYIDLGNPTALRLTGSMTIEAWIQAAANPADDGQIVAKSNDSAGWQLKTTPDTGKQTFGIGVSPSSNTITQRYSSTTRSLNTWYHVASVYNASAGTLDLYVNGALNDGTLRGRVPASQFNSSVNVNIGRRTGGYYFNGIIDEVRIYNRALSAAEIQGDMNTPLGSTGVDTQPPTAPAGLTATVVSGTQINLSWTASTDNAGVTGYLVERCQGAGCTTFTQVGTPAITTFTNTGLTAGTSYSYRVRATDAAGNLSAYSAVASATTSSPDTQPPTAPASLTATAVNGGEIDLGWAASTDNVGVTAYAIERCQGTGCGTFASLATVSSTSYSDTGLTSGTSYTYRVRATDAAGNFSSYSPQATATTLTMSSGLIAAYSFDEGAGTTAGDLSGNSNTGTIANATWTTAGKFGNALVFNGSNATVNINDSAILRLTTGMTLEAWVNPTTISSAWRDVIYKGNDNYYLEATTSQSGFPGAGSTIGAQNATAYGTSVLAVNTWSHLAETYDGTALRLYVNGVLISSVALTGNIATSTNPLQIGGDIIFGQYFAGTIDEVRIYNTALTQTQIQADMTTPVAPSGPDTQPPTAPSNLTATPISSTQITLNWTASTDNVGLHGYSIERCLTASCTFVEISPYTTSTIYNDTGLSSGTGYSYRVRASDSAGNLSPYSNVASATTPATDTQTPSAPTNLTATASGTSQINLSWTPASDNVGVTGNFVERCQGAGCSTFAQIVALGSVSTYSDTGLAAGQTYSYRIRATDAAGNLGPYSATATASTPTVTSGLVAAYSFTEGTGSTTSDASGNGLTGTLQSTTWTTSGKYDNALVFNGTTSYVDLGIPNALQLTSSATWSAWVYATANPSDDGQIIAKSGNTDGWQLKTTPDTGKRTFGLAISNGTNSIQRYSNTVLSLNTWYHVAGVYNAATQTLDIYVNGSLDNGTLSGVVPPTQNNPASINVNIGKRNGGYYFIGRIDEVRVYNRALSQTEIQNDMNTPVGSTASLPIVTLSSTSATFGNQATGTTSAPQSITVTNSGGAPLAIAGIAVTGPNSSDFAQTNTCGSTLAAGANCSIAITFTPTNTGTRNATVGITDNATSSPQTVSLTGTGIGFAVVPKATALTSSVTQQFSVVNGSGTVTWLVDGVVGGSATSGTITSLGLYTPPAPAGTHTITANTSTSQTASAIAYITNYPGTFTFHNDNLRTGQNLNESVLTPANVNSAQFGKLFSYATDGVSHASPLYVANVNIPGSGLHNVVYVATEHDSVFAFDADGRSSNPLWKTSFINPAAGITTIPAADTGEVGDTAPEIGITGTPVIDPASGTLYVVADTKEVSGGVTKYFQRLHALDITTGAEKLGGPVVIQGSVTGTGAGSQGGTLQFDPLRENQRVALLLSNGVIYMAFASHGDQAPYHGWVMGYNATTLQQTLVWCVSPNASEGGIWQSGSGLASDSTGGIYFATANGGFDANTGGIDYGDSIMKLTPAGLVSDYFTPGAQATMDANNWDFASSGPLLLPDQPGSKPHLIVMAGKTGTIYVVDRDNMGHFSSTDNQIVQSIPNAFPNGTPEPGNNSHPIYFNGTVFFGPISDTIKAFRLNNGLLSTSPSSSSATYPYPGAVMAISANGANNGILWAIQRNDSAVSDLAASTPAVLRAYSATNVGTEIYNSSQAGSRDTLDSAAKFTIPLVANGKVFVLTYGQLSGFGLLP